MNRRTMLRRFVATGLSCALAPTVSAAAPKPELWPRWQGHDENNAKLIDHGIWTEVLERRWRIGEDGVARFDYAGASGNDRARLGLYISQLERLPISTYPRDEQLAYWLNLYNAATVKIVLDWYPRASILSIEISPGLMTKGPWGSRFLTVETENLSLDDVEHRILRPVWADPRLLYGLCRAALGSPNLAPRPYGGLSVQEQLDAAARAFVNHPRGARVEGGKLRLSEIYRDYEADFGGSRATVIQHLAGYAQGSLAAALAGKPRLAYDAFSWALNDTTPAAGPAATH